MKIMLQLPLWFGVFLLFYRPLAAGAELAPFTVETARGTVPFEVEAALTPQQQTQGLMFRQYLPPGKGMLFLFPAPQKISMWMKNTYIPLDMLFIDSAGQVAYVKENASPLSEELITSPVPVIAVVELPGGTIQRTKIAEGDRVHHERLP